MASKLITIASVAVLAASNTSAVSLRNGKQEMKHSAPKSWGIKKHFSNTTHMKAEQDRSNHAGRKAAAALTAKLAAAKATDPAAGAEKEAALKVAREHATAQKTATQAAGRKAAPLSRKKQQGADRRAKAEAARAAARRAEIEKNVKAAQEAEAKKEVSFAAKFCELKKKAAKKLGFTKEEKELVKDGVEAFEDFVKLVDELEKEGEAPVESEKEGEAPVESEKEEEAPVKHIDDEAVAEAEKKFEDAKGAFKKASRDLSKARKKLNKADVATPELEQLVASAKAKLEEMRTLKQNAMAERDAAKAGFAADKPAKSSCCPCLW